MNMYLQTKFFIFQKFFTNFQDRQKITVFLWSRIFRSSDSLPILKNSKKILKNIKFSLQIHIHMKIMLNDSDRPLRFFKTKILIRIIHSYQQIFHYEIKIFVHTSNAYNKNFKRLYTNKKLNKKYINSTCYQVQRGKQETL